MRQYRVIAAPAAGGTITCRAEVHAWSPESAAWAWEPVDVWTVADLVDLSTTLAEHGWAPTGKTPARLPATIPVTPEDRFRIVEGLATQLQALQAETTRYQTALKNVLSDIPPIHKAGYVGTTHLSRILGLSRQQLHLYTSQMRDSLREALATSKPPRRHEILNQLSETEVQKISPQ